MDVVVEAEGPDQLRDLYAWLREEPELRGHVRMAEQEPKPGTMGAVTTALQLALASGQAFVAVSTVLVAWLRTRSGEVNVKITRGDQQIEVTTKGVKDLNSDQVHALIRKIAKTLDTPDASRKSSTRR